MHNNLFTNIDAGLAKRIFASGGEKSRGANSGEQGCAVRQAAATRPPCAHLTASLPLRPLINPCASAAANTTWWNVHHSKLEPAELPACGFGPLLNFFGYWDAPARGRRLLLAAATPANTTVPADAAAVAATGGPEKVQALVAGTSNYCSREGWLVEQAGKRTIEPPDLHAAQVAARRAGRMR